LLVQTGKAHIQRERVQKFREKKAIGFRPGVKEIKEEGWGRRKKKRGLKNHRIIGHLAKCNGGRGKGSPYLGKRGRPQGVFHGERSVALGRQKKAEFLGEKYSTIRGGDPQKPSTRTGGYRGERR